MSPEDVRNHREQIAYMKDIKEMILSDARVLYSAQGYTSHKSTFDITTSTYGGAYQATLIVYPDLTTDTRFTTLYEGLRCRNLCGAMKMLWDGLQTSLGNMKAMYSQHVAVMYASPVTTTSDNTTMSPKTPTRPSATETPVPSIETPSPTEQST